MTLLKMSFVDDKMRRERLPVISFALSGTHVGTQTGAPGFIFFWFEPFIYDVSLILFAKVFNKITSPYEASPFSPNVWDAGYY